MIQQNTFFHTNTDKNGRTHEFKYPNINLFDAFKVGLTNMCFNDTLENNRCT